MRLLLDTQIFLWCLDQSHRIPAATRDAIEDGANVVFVSAAAIWEIAIKAALRRIQMSPADLQGLPRLIEVAGFEELPVRARHAAAVHRLPLHHRDPFDRLLIAQARDEGLTLASVDPAMRAYEVALL